MMQLSAIPLPYTQTHRSFNTDTQLFNCLLIQTSPLFAKSFGIEFCSTTTETVQEFTGVFAGSASTALGSRPVSYPYC